MRPEKLTYYGKKCLVFLISALKVIKKGQYLNVSNTAQTVGSHKPPTPRGLHSTLSVSTRRFFQLMNTIYHFEKKMSRKFLLKRQKM